MADGDSEQEEMQAILRGMGLSNEAHVLQKFTEERITPAVVSCLSDDQLVGLGVTTIGDRTTLRHKCQRGSKGGSDSVKAELQSVMRPLGGSQSYSGYDPHATIPRRGKGKHRIGTKYTRPKAKRMNTFKNVNIIRYMGPHAPREFGRSEKDILCTFFYELSAGSNGEEIMSDITRLAKQAHIEGCDMSTLECSDMEFVKCAGKVCRVPQTESGFSWSTEAIRTLTGHGDLYIRLRKSFDRPTHTTQPTHEHCCYEDEGQSSSLACTEHPVEVQSAARKPKSRSVSRSPVVLPAVGSSHSPGQASIDLTQECVQHPLNELISSSEEEFPLVLVKKEHLLTKARLYEIFSSSASDDGVDEIVRLCNGDAEHAFKVLLGGPEVCTILQLKRSNDFVGHSQKLYISDEDDVVEDALLHYKHHSFDPLSRVRISYRNQPAIDTGGVTRQFFTDVLSKIAQQGALQLFVGPNERLRLAYSPQVLPVMKILGTLIGHSLLHEGPGFPYLAPFVYWYVATGSEERALPYVSIKEDLSGVTSMVVTELQQAKSEVEFDRIFDSPNFAQLLESSGCRRLPTFRNKDAIAQDFILHDTLLRGKSALEQISSGLASVGLLNLIRLFPTEFEPLFTNQSDTRVTSTAILQLLKFPRDMNEQQQVTAGMLRQFICSCSLEDLCRLLRYITGSECLPPSGYSTEIICVELMETDAIIGATCALKLTLPTHFENYDDFSLSLKAVLPAGKKSFTMI